MPFNSVAREALALEEEAAREALHSARGGGSAIAEGGSGLMFRLLTPSYFYNLVIVNVYLFFC